MNTNRSDMHEEGVVRELRGHYALVETVQQEACAYCEAKGACMALGGEKQRVVSALNQARAEPGDRVQMAMTRKAVLGASFLVYMVPVIALILGAALGKAYGPSYGWDAEPAAMASGVVFLAVSWMGLRAVSRRVAGKKDFAVRVVRILAKGEANAVDEYPVGV